MEIMCTDWPIARIDSGWRWFDREHIIEYANAPHLVRKHAAFRDAGTKGLAITDVPVREFVTFAGKMPAPNHKSCKTKNRVKWVPTVLLDLENATFRGKPTALIAPLWLHPDVFSQSFIPCEALARYVPSLLGRDDCRTVSARELIAASDETASRLDEAFWQMGAAQ